MISTRFGSKVRTIFDYEEDTGAVLFVRDDDGAKRKCHISELKADGGAVEIIAAASDSKMVNRLLKQEAK